MPVGIKVCCFSQLSDPSLSHHPLRGVVKIWPRRNFFFNSLFVECMNFKRSEWPLKCAAGHVSKNMCNSAQHLFSLASLQVLFTLVSRPHSMGIYWGAQRVAG